jgi:hypothetical protein
MIAAVSVSYLAGRGRKDPSNEQVPALFDNFNKNTSLHAGDHPWGKKFRILIIQSNERS